VACLFLQNVRASRKGRDHRRRDGPEYPYLAEVVTEFATSGGYDYTEDFEFGLDFILDGLERFKKAIGSGRSSGGARS
jgi:hypothetical protein